MEGSAVVAGIRNVSQERWGSRVPCVPGHFGCLEGSR